MRYEVSIHEHGRKRITRDCPAQGLLEWPAHKWTRITSRPLGLDAATRLASEQAVHAVVNGWQTADKFFDNGKRPGVPKGWEPADAIL
jgi:hypothetical protein